MRLPLRRLLPQGRFLRRLMLLSGGTVLGQGLIVLSSPLLTRLFGPAEFGAFAVFSALTGILGTVAALRYEFAVPVARDADEAAHLVLAASLASLVVALLLTGLVWLAGPAIAGLVGLPEIALWLWLVPPALLLWGIGSGLSFWSVQLGTFRINALNRILQSGSQAGGQVLFGLGGLGSAGLILGYALGYLVRTLHLLLGLPAAERARLGRPSWRSVWALARQHWRYPVYSGPSSLLQSACQLLPAVLVAGLYGPAAAGWFALSQRIMGLPVRVLSEAASQVFLGEVAQVQGAALRRLFLQTAGLFLLLGSIGMLPLLLVGPGLFALVFGEAWREAGIMVQLLVPLYLARFVVLPVSQTLNVLQRQDLHLLSSLLNAGAMAASFALGALLELGTHLTIGLFSLSSTLAFVFYLAAAWRAARRAAASPTGMALA